MIQNTGRRNWPLAVILVLVSGLAPETALAGSDESSAPTSLFDQKYLLALGGFFPQVRSTLTLTSPRGLGREVSLEDDLGVSGDTSSAWISFNWRFKPRHQFQAEWFQINRDGRRTADRPFEIGDTTIGVGASLDSEIKFNVGRLTYGYSFFRDEKLDVAFLVGAHFATVKATVTAAGNVSVNGTPITGRSRTESSSTKTFPLPHIGGSATYEFTPKLTGEFSLLVFALDLGDYSGSLLETDAFMAYQLTKHFGIGGGLKYVNLNLKANTSRGGSAAYNFNFFGPAIFGYASF